MFAHGMSYILHWTYILLFIVMLNLHQLLSSPYDN